MSSHKYQPPMPELTLAEINALQNAARDRESLLRSRGTFSLEYPETDLIESAIRKMRDRWNLRHPSILHPRPRVDPEHG